ncbi:MAG: hypothetical protein DRJ03_11145 [Chloroflexi bacterium]|nr:MAG: hypothetical protein DRJ03_11145 [Chloroflexota bacterium]
MPNVFKVFRDLFDGLATVLKYPVLLALFALDVVVIIPFCFFVGFPQLGLTFGLGVLLASQTPIIYLIAKEIWRQLHMLPMSEAWETTWEQWQEALEYFINLDKNSKET